MAAGGSHDVDVTLWRYTDMEAINPNDGGNRARQKPGGRLISLVTSKYGIQKVTNRTRVPRCRVRSTQLRSHNLQSDSVGWLATALQCNEMQRDGGRRAKHTLGTTRDTTDVRLHQRQN